MARQGCSKESRVGEGNIKEDNVANNNCSKEDNVGSNICL
jgi:hypothetical protein